MIDVTVTITLSDDTPPCISFAVNSKTNRSVSRGSKSGETKNASPSTLEDNSTGIPDTWLQLVLTLSPSGSENEPESFTRVFSRTV